MRPVSLERVELVGDELLRRRQLVKSYVAGKRKPSSGRRLPRPELPGSADAAGEREVASRREPRRDVPLLLRDLVRRRAIRSAMSLAREALREDDRAATSAAARRRRRRRGFASRLAAGADVTAHAAPASRGDEDEHDERHAPGHDRAAPGGAAPRLRALTGRLARPLQVARQEVRRGARVLGRRSAAAPASAVVKRSSKLSTGTSTAPAAPRRTPPSRAPARHARRAASAAGRRRRARRSSSRTSSTSRSSPAPLPGALHDAERPGDGARRVGDRDPGARGAVVEREHLHGADEPRVG